MSDTERDRIQCGSSDDRPRVAPCAACGACGCVECDDARDGKYCPAARGRTFNSFDPEYHSRENLQAILDLAEARLRNPQDLTPNVEYDLKEIARLARSTLARSTGGKEPSDG